MLRSHPETCGRTTKSCVSFCVTSLVIIANTTGLVHILVTERTAFGKNRPKSAHLVIRYPQVVLPMLYLERD